MGNSLAQFYAPPTPPTELSSDKYFWISPNKEDGRVEYAGDTLKREIPVVYITQEKSSSSNVGSNTSSDDTSFNDRSAADGLSEGEARDESTTPARYTILYCHGHDVDLGMIYDFLLHLSKLLNVDILSFDYAGYGLSLVGKQDVTQAQDDVQATNEQEDGMGASGPPSEDQCYSDVQTCFHYLVREKNVPPQNIILYGKSLGTGPVCWLAHKLCEEATVKKLDAMDEQQQQISEMVASISLKEDIGAGDNGNASATSSPNSNNLGSAKSSTTNKSVKSRVHTPIPSAAIKSVLASSTPPPLGGIVLHSPFLSMLRLQLGQSIGSSIVGSVVDDAFDNMKKIQELHSATSSREGSNSNGRSSRGRSNGGWGYRLPIYIIHGRHDSVVPFYHGEVLHGLVMERRKRSFPPFWAGGGTHWNIEVKYATAYIKRLQQFIRHCDKTNNGNIDKKKNRSRSRSRSVPRTTTSGVNQEADHETHLIAFNNPHVRGRSAARLPRPSNTAAMHHRARSSSKARQRKKKGTLVMRGGHDDTADVHEEMLPVLPHEVKHAKVKAHPIRLLLNGNRSQGTKSLGAMDRESRNPPS